MLTDAHYGLGWRIYQLGEHRLAYHSGWVSGYRADIAWSEQYDLGFAILLNEEANSINELTTTFWEMAFATLQPPSIASTDILKHQPPQAPHIAPCRRGSPGDCNVTLSRSAGSE